MPRVDGDALQFVYLCDPTRDHRRQGAHRRRDNARRSRPTTSAAARNAIAFDGGWLALIHEVRQGSRYAERFYQHRFVWFDAADATRRVSRPFFFNKKGIEFAAGLAWHPDGKRLLISYGVGTAKPGSRRSTPPR